MVDELEATDSSKLHQPKYEWPGSSHRLEKIVEYNETNTLLPNYLSITFLLTVKSTHKFVFRCSPQSFRPVRNNTVVSNVFLTHSRILVREPEV